MRIALAIALLISTPVLAQTNLVQFGGKEPSVLLKDPVIGKEIRKIVPQPQQRCMLELFNHLSDLRLQDDGSVMAEAIGSHADNFMYSFVYVSPNREIAVGLSCDDDRSDLYTNDRKSQAAKAGVNWLQLAP